MTLPKSNAKLFHMLSLSFCSCKLSVIVVCIFTNTVDVSFFSSNWVSSLNVTLLYPNYWVRIKYDKLVEPWISELEHVSFVHIRLRQ
jgi:hypothetical protein